MTRAVVALVIILGTTGATVAPASASVLYGTHQGAPDQFLYVIDQNNGAATFVGDIGRTLADLTSDNVSTLWGVDFSTNELVTLNPATAAVTSAVTISGISGGQMVSLAYDTSTGTLYGNTTAFTGPGDFLYTIDTGTGAATLVGGLAIIQNIGLAFDGAGQLYASGFTNGSLYTVDKNTGAVTAVVPEALGYPLYGDIAFRPEDDTLFASRWFSSELVTLDPGTVVETLVGPFGGGPNIGGLAFLGAVPEPATLAVLGLGLVGLGLVRRRGR